VRIAVVEHRVRNTMMRRTMCAVLLVHHVILIRTEINDMNVLRGVRDSTTCHRIARSRLPQRVSFIKVTNTKAFAGTWLQKQR
jgi:hypothetical protein